MVGRGNVLITPSIKRELYPSRLKPGPVYDCLRKAVLRWER